MIDVRFLIAQGLWILGASVLLATGGYYDWLARVRGQSRMAAFREGQGRKLSVPVALAMISAGFLLMTSSPWSRVVWSGVLAGGLYDLWRHLRPR